MNYAREDCEMCEGTGILFTPARQVAGNIVDEQEFECLCVRQNRAEMEGEMQMETLRGN